MKLVFKITLMILLSSTWAHAKTSEFEDGPVISGYGKHAPVQQDVKLEKDTLVKVVFDVSKSGKDGALNRGFDSVARFLNMHVANGIPVKNIQLSIVIHGSASNEMLDNKAYKAKFGVENSNIELISTLLENNVKFVQCGQSAAYHQIANKNMIKGVDMALSAMTAHVIFAKKGYSQNPF